MTPAAPGGFREAAEVLPPGLGSERSIGAGEVHAWRLAVAEDPVLVAVEQRSVDLVLEIRGPAGETFGVAAGNGRWGPEVALLAGAGEHRIEVRPKEKSIWPGRYAIRVEPTPSEGARRDALALMSQAGREAFADTPDARRQAAASYRRAADAWRALGDRRWEAEAFSCLAGLEEAASEFRAAAESNERAQASWRELAEPRREAAALNELGFVHLSTGETRGARAALESAAALWSRHGERFDEAETVSNLCFLEQLAGDLAAALACYEQPRAVFREFGVQAEEQRILNNLGGIYDLLGEPEAALEHYRQSLALRRALGDRLGEAQSLNNLAVIHRILGEWQEALRLYGEAREIVASLGERALEASLLANVGFTYDNLGEPQRALPFLEGALELRREIGDRRGEVITLNNLGLAWRRLGEPVRALEHHRRALELAATLGDGRQDAVTRLRLGELHLEQGDAAAALAAVEPALAYFDASGLRHSETQALQIRGRALTLAGRPREALPVLEDVLARRRSQHHPAGEAEALHALALAERSLDLPDDARAHAEAAVARAEELRTGFVSPGLRAAFLATQRRAYSLLIDLLIDRHAADPGGGWDRAAFEVSERARARSLLDALDSSGAARASTVAPAELIERRRSLHRRLSAKAYRQLEPAGEKAEALTGEIAALLAELDELDGEIRRHDPLGAALSRPQPLGPEEIAALLDPGTLVLEYALGEERSVLWVIGAGGLRTFTLPPQREIDALARRAYAELSTVEAGSARREEAAEELGRVLLEPFWSAAAGVERLAVVPDAALHFLPFGALPAPPPGRGWDALDRLPLLEHCEVVDLPSATTLALQRRRLASRPPAAKLAAVLADPVFDADDPRLELPPGSAGSARLPAERVAAAGREPGAAPALPRLLSSREEAEAIAGLAPPGQVWTALDLAAGREAVLDGDLRGHRIVHFATHGVADTGNPERSGLVLSLVDAGGRPREGFLGLREIHELDLDADLVVLSGCQTALGRELRGEGLMSLTRGFVHAGVPRVVASLWRVQDRTTAELMTRFYRAMWQEGLPPAAALREAQRSLRREPRYRDPYSWAGFVLQGDWR